MGAYSPTPLVTEDVMRAVEEKILVPTVHQMKRSRRPFRGVLYAGLMITTNGVRVLEYNVRFGDPECQPLMLRLEVDLVELLEASVDGHADEVARCAGSATCRLCRDGRRGVPGPLRARA